MFFSLFCCPAIWVQSMVSWLVGWLSLFLGISFWVSILVFAGAIPKIPQNYQFHCWSSSHCHCDSDRFAADWMPAGSPFPPEGRECDHTASQRPAAGGEGRGDATGWPPPMLDGAQKWVFAKNGSVRFGERDFPWWLFRDLRVATLCIHGTP